MNDGGIKFDQSATGSGSRLIEGRDFVIESGYMVLTREYLLNRGKCCGSGCRNCPYKEGRNG